MQSILEKDSLFFKSVLGDKYNKAKCKHSVQDPIILYIIYYIYTEKKYTKYKTNPQPQNPEAKRKTKKKDKETRTNAKKE